MFIFIMYKLLFGSTKIHSTTAGEPPSFNQEPWQAELDSAYRVLCSSRRVGQVHSLTYDAIHTGRSEPHTKCWNNNIKMGHHRRPKSQMPRSMNINAEVSYTVQQLALQHFPASALLDMTMTFKCKKKKVSLFVKFCSNIWTHLPKLL